MQHGVVIVGASIAGYNTAKELRKQGFKEKITLITKQDLLPYNLYPLSKEWMHDAKKQEPPLFNDQDFFDQEQITVLKNTEIVALHPEEKTIESHTGEKISYDRLVLAVGSNLRTLEVPGADAHGLFYLRDFENASAIKDWSKQVTDLVLVGAGFIGLELASTFSQLGIHVTVIEHSEFPLGRILGNDASTYFTKMHREHGVEILTKEGVTGFEKDAQGNVSFVQTESGKKVPAQMVIVGIGVIPNTSITHPNLEIARGIVVNEYGETSIPDIYAAGDCTVWPYQGEQIHVEHWEHARAQGRAVAHNLIKEKSDVYAVRPYFWTDQYDQTFEYLGHALTWERILVRGSLATREFSLAYVDKENKPIAILFANNSEKRAEVAAFMDQNRPIDEDKFSDRNIPFQEF